MPGCDGAACQCDTVCERFETRSRGVAAWLATAILASLTGLVTALGCGPRPHLRNPGILGLEKDWTEALGSRDPGRLAALFRDRRLERAPGLILDPGPRLGGRLVPLHWRPDPKSPLGRGMLGQLEVLESVTLARVRRSSFHALGARRAVAGLRIRLDGTVRGGYPRSDTGVVEVSLWRRAYHGPWYVADFKRVSMTTLVGLGQSFVDRTAAWRPARGLGRRRKASACFGSISRRGGRLVAADDFDGDGRVDLACWNGTRLTVWRGGDSGFRLWGPDLSPPRGDGLGKTLWRLVDRDGDGRSEILLARGVWVGFSSGTPGWEQTGVQVGNVNGYATEPLPRSLRVQLGEEAKLVAGHASVDLDQDGRPEQIVLLREPSRPADGATALRFRLYWWLPGTRESSGQGRWLDVTHVAGLPRRVSSFSAADFDGDGGVDLALATASGVKLYRNLFDRGQWGRVEIVGPKGRVFLNASMTVKAPDGRVLRHIRIGVPGLPLSRLVVGLGKLDRATLSLRFPGGPLVEGTLEAGGTAVLSASHPVHGKDTGITGLGPTALKGPEFGRWLGLPSPRAGVGNGGDVVLLVCSGAESRSCRDLAAKARGIVVSRGLRARLIVAWLGTPSVRGTDSGGWTETTLDRKRSSMFIGAMLLPRVLFYRDGKLMSVVVRPDPRRLAMEMAARFGSSAR